jgi:hypothetical protein
MPGSARSRGLVTASGHLTGLVHRHAAASARWVAAHTTAAHSALCMTMQRLLKTLQARSSLLTYELHLCTVIDAHSLLQDPCE